MVIDEKNGVTIVTVRVIPRSSRSEIVGESEGAVKVRLTSPPVDGAANAELIKLFSKTFDVARSAVEIFRGETSRTKQLRLTGVSAEAVRNAIR